MAFKSHDQMKLIYIYSYITININTMKKSFFYYVGLLGFLSILQTQAQPSAPKTVLILLYEDIEILDFAGPMEVFMQAGLTVYTVAPSRSIKAMGKLQITPDYVIGDKEIPHADIVALPGGDGAMDCLNNKKTMDWIKQVVNQSSYNFSVCTGAYLLADTGILDGKKSTTFHTLIEDMRKRYPKVEVLSEVRFVDNGKEITTAGISAGIDGALYLVAKLYGESLAKRVARTIEYDKWTPNEGYVVGKN